MTMIVQTPGSLDRQTAAAIGAYRPCAVSEAAGVCARQMVAAVSPGGRDRAKALLFAAGCLAAFAEGVGLELCPEALLSEATIERFIASATQRYSPATRRTLRTNLRSLARAREREPLPAALPREHAKAPYSNAEIDGFLRLAGAQSTEARAMRASALVCLGAGAGIVAGELRHIRGQDVIHRFGGLVVVVSGRRARTVPVLARLKEPLIAAARFAGERLICGGRDPGRRNVSDVLTAALCADSSLPRLQAGRLRSTWLHQTAQLIGLQAFMAAAGVRCSQRLGDIAAGLPRANETEIVALLSGSP